MNATEQPTAAIERTDAPETRSHETIDRFRVGIADVDGDCVDGATLLDWIYRAAHRTAELWSGTRCVLASVGNLHLDRPIAVGECVEVRAGLVYTGRSSMHLLITVRSGDPDSSRTIQTAQCAMIFVAADAAREVARQPAKRTAAATVARRRMAQSPTARRGCLQAHNNVPRSREKITCAWWGPGLNNEHLFPEGVAVCFP